MAALKAEYIRITTSKLDIDKSKFDPLVEKLLNHPGDCVVDTGASSFMAMMSYLRENRIFEFLANYGKRVVIHAPLVGGSGMDETIRGLMSILEFENVSVVVWENTIQGQVEKDGIYFRESALYKSGAEKILGVVKLEARSPEYLKVMSVMTKARLTFAEASQLPDFFTIERQRLTWMWRDITDQLDVLDL